MLLFLSRTKLPGRQPSEVKFGSRPRLYNCGLVALEVDRLFQAHKGNHVHRLPHGTNRICVPTGNWFYIKPRNFKGDKLWHFSREWETINIQSERLL